MKKVFLFTLILVLSINAISCKKEKESSAKKNISSKNYIVDTDNSIINWTAYKTTDRVPVKGVFNEVKILHTNNAENPAEILNGLEFEIPVESIFTKDTIRDSKIKQSFFGVMENTKSLYGKISMDENGTGNIDLTMNGITKNFPYTYEVRGEKIDLNAIIDLQNWQAQAAIHALNAVCFDMHKGADGISKTWNDVAINVQVKTLLQK